MTARRLLVVDDEADFCDFVRNVAEGMGYVVETTTEPRDFNGLYETFAPTAIVLDVVMPDVDGIELVQWLSEQNCDAKILVVTGYNPSYSKAAKVLGEVAGVLSVETLNKPVSLVDLREALS